MDRKPYLETDEILQAIEDMYASSPREAVGLAWALVRATFIALYSAVSLSILWKVRDAIERTRG
jgi:hypothetical protein